MQAGSEPRIMKRCCIVNDKGFVSAYALAMLCIILSFVGLCIAQVQLCAVLLQQNKQHEIELYILHHIKIQLQQISKIKEEEETDKEGKMEEHQEPVEDTNKEEQLIYHNTDISITYADSHVQAAYSYHRRSHTMIIQLNEQKEIMDIAYS